MSSLWFEFEKLTKLGCLLQPILKLRHASMWLLGTHTFTACLAARQQLASTYMQCQISVYYLQSGVLESPIRASWKLLIKNGPLLTD